MSLSDTPKPKLKSPQGKLPFWMRISDVLRLGKPFEMRVNLTEEQCKQAILNYKWGEIPSIEGTRFSIEQGRFRDITYIEGELQGDPNMEITHIKGKVYESGSASIVQMGVVMALLGILFPDSVKTILGYMFFLIIMLTITLYYFLDKQKKVSQEFEAYLKSVENDPSLLTDQKFISG